MEFKISNFNIMSDKHFDFFTWDEVKDGEPEDSREERYDQVIRVIAEINYREKIDVMTFQEVTSNSIEYLADATNNDYELYVNKIKSDDKPMLLVTMIKNDLVTAVANNIVDLTDNYQNFYNKNNYHSDKDDYFSGRAQVFYIKTKNLIVVNVHAPGIPDGFVQKLWYKSISAFIRCGCPINQEKSLYCYPDNQDIRIILIGDFNVPYKDKLKKWTNEGNYNAETELILFEDNKNRKTSFHSGIKDQNTDTWFSDPKPYQKVDHLMKTNNFPDPELFVYVSQLFDRRDPGFINANNISNKIIPYKRDPELYLPEGGVKIPAIISAGDYPNGNWMPNFDINIDIRGWPSDHTFNLYVFPNIPDIRNPLRGGGSSKEKRRYKIIY